MSELPKHAIPMSAVYRGMPPAVSVDRVCDVHFIEAWARRMRESVHCEMWDSVRHVERGGVLVMDCPIDGEGAMCSRLAGYKVDCGFGMWEDRRYGESLWPIP